MRTIDLITPDWDAPPSVRAASTTRHGGVSQGAWQGLNLAEHVHDNTAHVEQNRQLIKETLHLSTDPHWLTQVHGDFVLDITATDACEADAAFTDTVNEVCVVMTADCLPVLFCDQAGKQVAAAHAGWRGLAGGILEATLSKFAQVDQVMAWLGPAIGPKAFEVGPEVRDAFIADQAEAVNAFVENRPGHWLADIYSLARLRLQRAGVKMISGGGFCTYSDADRFYSFRRDEITGRMASLIWIDE